MYTKAIINGKLYLDDRWIISNLYIDKEKIALISEKFLPAEETIDANNMQVLPGIIDPHVHFELDLGFITSVDDFYSGSVAAAYGGVTSIIDFLPPVDCVKDLKKAFIDRKKQAKRSIVDYHLHATIKQPKDNLEYFVIEMKKLGMHTLKLFTTYSDSNRRTSDEAIYELLKLSVKHDFLILAHIENDDLITLNDKFSYRDLPISRPTSSEMTQALKLAKFVKETGGRLYMVHLSSGATLQSLIEQYSNILNSRFFVESCPQYFTYTNDVYNRQDGYLFSFAPPLRNENERQLLLDNIDFIDTIGTDHCAFMAKDKKHDLLTKTPLGIGGIEHSFSVMHKHVGDLVIKKMTSNVAEIQGLANKGKLEVGYDADIVLFNPSLPGTINTNHGSCDYSVYQGFQVTGRVIATMVRGKFIMKDDKLLGGQGKWIEARGKKL
jgi:dihydropyrimidinase